MNPGCATKRLSPASAAQELSGHRILAPWEEAVGVHHSHAPYEGSLLAEIGPVRVYLPLELEPELRSLIGKKIAILRTDNPVKPYRIRQVGD